MGDIRKAIKFITQEGLTTKQCYPDKPLSMPSPNCPRYCSDGERLESPKKARFVKYQSAEEVFGLLKSKEKAVALAIVKVDPTFNFYSSFHAHLNVKFVTFLLSR